MGRYLLIVLIFVALYNLLFFHIQAGIGMGLLVSAINLFFYLTRNNNSKNINTGLLFSALATLFGFFFGWRDSGVVQVSNFLTTGFLSSVAFYLYKSEKPFQFSISETIFLPLITLKSQFLGGLSLRSPSFSKSPKDDSLTYFMRGFLIAVPLVVILLMLLMSADPVFAKLADILLKDIRERLIVSTLVFLYLFIVGKSVVNGYLKDKVNFEVPATKFFELVAILGSIVLLFSTFILVQLKYLFFKANEQDLASIGISSQTYSEYVRRGFFELLVVSAIISLLISYLLKFLHKLKPNHQQITKCLSAVMILETGVILASAFQRVNMYSQDHGLTRARMFGMIFFIWLSLMLLVLLVEVVKKQRERYIFIATSTVTLLALFLINFINIDGLMATKYKPTVNSEIDYFYLTAISTDAYPSWKEAIEEAEVVLAQLEANRNISSENGRIHYWTRTSLEHIEDKVGYLMNKYGSFEELEKKYRDRQSVWVTSFNIYSPDLKVPQNILYSRKWQSFRYSEFRAYQYILENQETFKKLPLLIDKASKIDEVIPEEVRSKIQYDRSLQAPLQ